eukprot:TRINITY_DN5961_c0_g1_i7.p1 TRINITY_DN5961_c0_g1~~TRINITY_DN5961_c0_g1_i7.p1  ORF type:complete len:253 (-),score=35.33 TRINITY_DN5961_c0_g1_i7:212-874(-)
MCIRDRCCACSLSDGRFVACGSVSGLIIIWDIESQSCIQRIQLTQQLKATLMCSIEKLELLASALNDNSIAIWDYKSGTVSSQLKRHNSSVQSLVAIDTQGILASGDEEGQVMIWDYKRWECRWVFRNHRIAVRALCCLSEFGWLASADDQKMIVWDPRTREVISEVEVRGVKCLLEMDGEQYLLVAGSERDGIILFDQYGIMTYQSITHRRTQSLFFLV